MFVGGPHSPIGRGSGLKIRQVSVRVRLGARLGRRNQLSVVSGFSQVSQSMFLPDNDVHIPTLVRPCSDGLASLRIFSDLHVTCGGGHGRANRSSWLAGCPARRAGAGVACRARVLRRRRRACQRHIVARWLIDFRGLMLTPDKTLIAMCPRQPYS